MGEECNDADGDSVCDDVDTCPGGDDNIDTDNDGIADFCDDCNEIDFDNDGVVDTYCDADGNSICIDDNDSDESM